MGSFPPFLWIRLSISTGERPRCHFRQGRLRSWLPSGQVKNISRLSSAWILFGWIARRPGRADSLLAPGVRISFSHWRQGPVPPQTQPQTDGAYPPVG